MFEIWTLTWTDGSGVVFDKFRTLFQRFFQNPSIEKDWPQRFSKKQRTTQQNTGGGNQCKVILSFDWELPGTGFQ
jgi:hypothetical protein